MTVSLVDSTGGETCSKDSSKTHETTYEEMSIRNEITQLPITLLFGR